MQMKQKTLTQIIRNLFSFRLPDLTSSNSLSKIYAQTKNRNANTPATTKLLTSVALLLEPILNASVVLAMLIFVEL